MRKNLSRKYSILKRKHKVLTGTHSTLLQVLESTNIGIFHLNRNWRYTFLNCNAGKYMSRDSNELLGKCIWEEFPEAADTEFARMYREVMVTGKPASVEEFYKPLNGWYEISAFPNPEGITVYYREITNRRSVEEELEKQKSFFEQMFLQSATSTQILDKDGWCLRINPKLTELFGVKPEDIEGRIYNIFNDEEIKRTGIDLILKEVFGKKQPAAWEVFFDIGNAADSQNIKVKERKKVWYANKSYPIIDKNGELLYVIIQHEDISERKNAEEALRQSEELFRSSFQNATTGVCLTAPDGRFIRINNMLCNMFGYSIEELQKMTFNDITYPEDKALGIDILQNLVSGKIDNTKFEKRYIRKDGQIIWARLSIAIVRDTLSEPLYFITYVQDITESKKAKELLKESEENFRTLFENAVLGIYRTTPDGRILMVNPALYKKLGYSSAEELMKRNLEENGFQPDYSRSAFKDNFLNNNNYVCLESEWTKADGTTIFVRENAKAVRNEAGEILFYDGTVEDITERKKAEQALILSEKKYRLLFENNPLPIWIYDLQTLNFLEVNNAAVRDYGYLKTEFLSMNIKDIRPQEDVEVLLKIISLDTDENVITTRHTKKNGEIIFVEVISHTIEYEGKRARLVISKDITERKRVQQELIRAKKDAEKSDKLKSEFLAQMSHEIRSPINTILNFISLIREEVSPVSPEMSFSFNAIDSSSRRLIRTIDLILNMSQIQTGYLECYYQDIDLQKDVLNSIIMEYSSSAMLKGLSLRLHNELGPAKINADVYSVTQIFSNLVNNAIKYTKAGEIVLRIYSDNKKTICVGVSDTGIGIAEDYIEHIFKPFSQEEQGYTRKFEGNGLGLALVKKYCELNKCDISVKSKKGEGSTFTVTFFED